MKASKNKEGSILLTYKEEPLNELVTLMGAIETQFDTIVTLTIDHRGVTLLVRCLNDGPIPDDESPDVYSRWASGFLIGRASQRSDAARDGS
jgi:hypothetical protein